jgi:hypothetical protein
MLLAVRMKHFISRKAGKHVLPIKLLVCGNSLKRENTQTHMCIHKHAHAHTKAETVNIIKAYEFLSLT